MTLPPGRPLSQVIDEAMYAMSDERLELYIEHLSKRLSTVVTPKAKKYLQSQKQKADAEKLRRIESRM